MLPRDLKMRCRRTRLERKGSAWKGSSRNFWDAFTGLQKVDGRWLMAAALYLLCADVVGGRAVENSFRSGKRCFCATAFLSI